MILDISGIELIPGNQGMYCPGNGMQKDVFGLPIECCCDECDYYIMEFIKNGLLVLNGYQYLTDSYLADSVLEKEDDDDTIFDKMVFITENLSDFNIETISKYLGIEDAFTKKSKRKNLT